MTESDAQLLSRYAETQHAEAFAELVRRHAGLVYGVCLRVLKNPDEAEDAAQECFVKLARHADGIRGSLPGWLHAVARNQTIKAIRSESARRRNEVLAMQESHSGTDSQWDEIAPLLDEAIAELPDELRETIVLQYLEGLTERQIAERLGVNPSTICRRSQKGLKILRAKLKKTAGAAAAASLAVLLSQHGAIAAPATLTAALGKMAIAGLAPIGAGTAAAAAEGTFLMNTKLGIAAAKTKSAFALAGLLALMAPVAVIGLLKLNEPVVPQAVAPPAQVAPVATPNIATPRPDRVVAQVAPPANNGGGAAISPPSPVLVAAPAPLTDRLGGAERDLAYVSTDKPVYRLGEKVYIRAVVLDAFAHTTITRTVAAVEILSPRGEVVLRATEPIDHSALGFAWPIDPSLAGGDYKVRISSPVLGFPPAERKFNIRAYRQPRLRTQIYFVREGYGPGDEVSAALSATRSEGGFPAGAKVTAIARVDQEEVWRQTLKLDEIGYAMATFRLPDKMATGEGTLTFAIEDGGVVETAAKTIPILMSTIDLKAYPEGGDLVAGVENRVYFEAIAPNGRPADLRAELTDGQGAVVLSAWTQHEGRGEFRFTPQPGQSYSLRAAEPASIKAMADLTPATTTLGLRAPQNVYEPGQPMTVEVAADGRPFRVAVAQREKTLAETTVNTNPERYVQTWAPVRLDLPAEADGVLRVTLYDADGAPRAERLVFRKPAKTLKVALELDKKSYVPGGKVNLIVKTTDQDGKPAPGVVGLTVTDDATLELIEKREQAPRLPVQVFLEPEVRELADARVYLSDDKDAPEKLDLLLGTQGWRRFAFVDAARIDAFLKEHGDAARRVLANRVRPAPRGGGIGGGGRGGRGGRGALGGAFQADAVGAEKGARLEPAQNAGMPLPQAMPMAPPVEPLDQDGDLDIIWALAQEQGQQQAADREPAMKEAEILTGNGIALFDQAARGGGGGGGGRGGGRGGRRPQFRDASLGLVAIYRVYAHTARPDRQPNDRTDFAETLYWNAGLATGADGTTSATFDLSDSITSFRAMADAYSSGGAFGTEDKLIESRRPFYIETKAPLETTDGDRINLPVALVNETDSPMTAKLDAEVGGGLKLVNPLSTVQVPARTRTRVVLTAMASASASPADFNVAAVAGDYSDRVARKIPVVPSGFPIALNRAGMLDKSAENSIRIPESIAGGLVAKAAVYPTPLSSLSGALESMIRDPNGCFEQTSSTNYPLVMAMQYFQSHTDVSPDLVARSREKLAAGYQRLTGFESKSKGYEWFGADPGHEALTAYGLMEFVDMQKTMPVDAAMVERTRQWLLAKRDGKGGFERSSKAVDSFGRAPEATTNAYIVWALAGAGEKGIGPELDAALKAAADVKDPYILALTAGALEQSGREADARPLLARLASAQAADGSLPGAETSITASRGDSLLIETTALAILAWLPEPEFAANVERGMTWLSSKCKGGQFGATQSTVLALKAIVEYDKTRSKPKADGRLALVVDGKEIQSLPFTTATEGALAFKDFAEALTPGEHQVTLRMEGGSPMPYSLEVEYNATLPDDAPAAPLELATKIADAVAEEGEGVEVIADLKNTSDKPLPMTMLIVGMPGGLEPRVERLQEAVKAGEFAFYEIRGRDVALYFRGLEPHAAKRIVISATAAAPGSYTGPASRAYLYYTPEQKKWAPGVKLDIAARQ